MSDRDTILQALKQAGEPLNAGAVADITGLERKTVDKVMAQLKAEGLIVSPKRCFWTVK